MQFIQTLLPQLPVSLGHVGSKTVSDLVDAFASLALHYFSTSNVATKGVCMHFGKSHFSVPGSSSLNETLESKLTSLLLQLFKLITVFAHSPWPEDPAKEPRTTEREEERKKNKNFLGDVIGQREETIYLLLQCLSKCQETNIGVLSNMSGQPVNGTENGEKLTINGTQVTVEDSILQLLCLLFSQTSHKEFLVKPLLSFISSSNSNEFSVSDLLSEPMLWFMLYVLAKEEAVRTFDEAGNFIR